MPTLSYRRLRGDLIETYKILHGIYDPETVQFMKLQDEYAPNMPMTRSGTRNDMKLFQNAPRLDVRKYSFSVRVVKAWNHLNHDIINAPSVNSFKNRLDNFYKDKEIYYDETYHNLHINNLM